MQELKSTHNLSLDEIIKQKDILIEKLTKEKAKEVTAKTQAMGKVKEMEAAQRVQQ